MMTTSNDVSDRIENVEEDFDSRSCIPNIEITKIKHATKITSARNQKVKRKLSAENRMKHTHMETNAAGGNQRRSAIRKHSRGQTNYSRRRSSVKPQQHYIRRRSSKALKNRPQHSSYLQSPPIPIKRNLHDDPENGASQFSTSPRRNAITENVPHNFGLKQQKMGRKLIAFTLKHEQNLAMGIEAMKLSKPKKMNSKKKPITNWNNGKPIIVIGSPIADTFTSTRSFDNIPTIRYDLDKNGSPKSDSEMLTKLNIAMQSHEKMRKKVDNLKTTLSSSPPSRSNSKQYLTQQSVITSTGKSQENCVWRNMTGERVELEEVDLLSLSESECFALQKVAAQYLHDAELCASFTIPKDEFKLMAEKKGFHILKANKNKSKKQEQVFAIPLVRVVENDQLLRLQTIEQDHTSCISNTFDASQDASDNDSLAHSRSSPKVGRRSFSSACESVFTSMPGSPVTSDDVDHDFHASLSPKTTAVAPVRNTLRRRAAINTEIDPDQSKLLNSLSASSGQNKKRSLLPPTMPQVPYVVQKCCAHLVKHGLDVTGIFRVPGSKKRVKQLREEFDRGVDVKVEDDYLAHDVAALFKEFFRDLPEALLTRELYQAFISTTKLGPMDRLTALRCLVWLLPMPNRDTLQQLLSFLATIADSSQDKVDASGKTVCGNKMGIPNLAMIFGPNILHRNKKTNSSSADAQYQVQSIERAEESSMVINVIEDMIRNQKELFSVPRETHGDVLRTLQESDPDALDVLLRRKVVNYARNGSPHTSSGQTSDGSVSDEEGRLSMKHFNELNANNNNNNNTKQPHVNGDERLHTRTKSAIRHDPVGNHDPHTQRLYTRPLMTENAEETVDRILDEISSSPSPFPKSMSFSDADMNEILYQESNPVKIETKHQTEAPDNKSPNANDTEEDLTKMSCVSNTTKNHTDCIKNSSPRPVPKPRSHKATSNTNEQSYKEVGQHSRRQAFSLNPRNSQTIPHETKLNNTKILILPEEDSTSGIADCDMYFDSSDDIGNGTNEHIPQRRSIHEQKSSSQSFHIKDTALSYEKAPQNTFAKSEDIQESPMRRRLPSTFNLRMNRTYGAHSHVAMHAVRIPKKRVENVSDNNNVIHRENDAEIRSHPVSRRFSKDDMFLTLEPYQHRHERRKLTNYDKLSESMV